MTKTQIINLAVIIFTVFSLRGQQYEFGINFGAGNYIGDIGNEYYFKPNKPGVGVMFKNTSNPWFGIRFSGNYHPLYANDLDSESLGRQKRGLMSKGTLFDFSLGIEYNFYPRNPFLRPKRNQRLTPYMYSGLGLGTFYGDVYKAKTEKKISEYSGSGFFIPMTLGVKYRLSTHLIVSIESNAKYYFSDNLDGTQSRFNTENLAENPKKYLRSNPNSNDWYTYTSFSLIYTFGDLLCYFNIR